MGRFRDGLKTRKCGCIVYEYGPPMPCPTHAARDEVQEEETLRKLVREQAAGLGHDLTTFTEYGTTRGKWTAYCSNCGYIAIVYDDPPPVGDQVAGWCLTRTCQHSTLAVEDTHGQTQGGQSAEVVEPEGSHPARS